MLKWPREILPKWRGWPGVFLAALCLIALGGEALPTPPHPQKIAQYQPPAKTANCYSTDDCPWWDYSAVWTAIFTAALTISTVGLWYFTWRTADAARVSANAGRESIKLARDEFNATHRPKLVVREISIFWVMEKTTLEFILINEGDGIAKNIRGNFFLNEAILGWIPAGRTPIIFSENLIPNELNPGIAAPCKGTVGINIPDFLNSKRTEHDPTTGKPIWSIYFEGATTYEGPSGIARRSAYYRPVDPESMRFLPCDDPDKEYPG